MKRKQLILASTLCMAIFALMIMLVDVQLVRAVGPLYVAPGGADNGDCTNNASPCATIQYAVGEAAPGDEIRVAIGTYTDTGDEVVLLNKNVTLSGGWDVGFTTQSGTSTIDGEGSRRGMTVNTSVTVIVESFTVQNSGPNSGLGGGIDNRGTLTLNNSTVSDNTVNFGNGGGIGNFGTLTLNNSSVSNNTSSHNGGGIYNGYEDNLTLNNSTVNGNAATGGGVSTTITVT